VAAVVTEMTEAPTLAVRHVSKNYGRFRALTDVTIDIADRGIHAIIGPNGAGKSTLLSILAGDIAGTSGTITVRGRDITGLSSHQRARLGIGRSYQHSAVFGELSIEQNILISLMASESAGSLLTSGPLRRHRERARETLRQVGLTRTPDMSAGALSHGEHRQLEIGMAIAQDPTLLLLDEPLAGLTRFETTTVNNLISRLREHCAVVLIEHDMASVFALSDRITVLVGGRVLREGTPEEIKTDDEVRRHYLGETTDE
jgi:branched-chain amino acid transport system ATP-binding protein